MATNHVTVMSRAHRSGCGRVWPPSPFRRCSWTASFFIEDGFIYAVIGGTTLALVVLVWWLFFSRASWFERIGALVVMVAAVFAMFRVVHPSVSNGMMGGMLPIFSIPLLCLGLVAWATVSHRLPGTLPIPCARCGAVLAAGVMTLVRTDGIMGSDHSFSGDGRRRGGSTARAEATTIRSHLPPLRPSQLNHRACCCCCSPVAD